MADFRPFRGWRYNSSKVKMDDVIAPPYDVISEAYQNELYQKSAFNCVRLILNKITGSDSSTDNRYTRANQTFTEWRQSGVIVHEESPAFYLYRQKFQDPETKVLRERTALLGRLKLEDFKDGIVIPHEKTLSAPKEDRKKLLEETQTNFSPIFGLYEDQEQRLTVSLSQVSNEKPVYQAKDDEGTEHYCWIIREPLIQEKISEILKSKKIYIADGHHRYQTALDHSRKKRAQLSLSADEELGSDFVLMALVEFHDPGLVLFPTHRMVTTLKDAAVFGAGEPDKGAVIQSLGEYFSVEKSSLPAIEKDLNRDKDGEVRMGIVIEGEAFLLTAKNWDKIKSRMSSGKKDFWYRLDVNLINDLIFKSLWQIPDAAFQSSVKYTHSTEEALAAAADKKAKVVFLLRAPKVEILRDMGACGELLPQKSTYFYPKLASGIVFHSHQ